MGHAKEMIKASSMSFSWSVAGIELEKSRRMKEYEHCIQNFINESPKFLQ